MAVPVWNTSRSGGLSLRTALTGAFFHKRIILLVALIPLLLGIAAALYTKTEYVAGSLLMVLINREYSTATQNVTDTGPDVLSIEGLKSVEAEVQILESSEVINKTIQDVGEDRIFPKSSLGLSRLIAMIAPPKNRDDALLEQFRKRLKAAVESDSNIIRVSFTHPDRALAIEVTDKLVENYLARRKQIFSNPTSPILSSEVERFESGLKTVDAELQKLKSDNGILDLKQDSILASNQLDSILQRRRQVAERQAAVAAQLTEAQKAAAGLPNMVFDSAEKTDAVPNNDDQNTLTRLLVERGKLLQEYLPAHPKVRQIERQIAAARAAIAHPEQRVFSTDRDVRNPSVNYMENMILSLRVEQDSLKNQLGELDDQVKAARERIAKLQALEPRITDLTRQRDNLNDSYREYLRRAVAASIEEAAADVRASNVRVVQRADSDVSSYNLGLPFVAAGLIGGMLFGAAAWAVAATLRSVFIQPQEAERVLQMPALAVFGDEANAYERLEGRQAISALAAQLADAASGPEPMHIIQIVAQDNAKDAISFSAGLGTELGAAQGLRTLVIDYAQTSEGAGHESSEKSAPEQEDVRAVATGTPNLWHAGRDGTPALFNLSLPIAETRSTLSKLREGYDIVLILMTAPEDIRIAQRLAPAVDGTLLMIRAEETRIPVALRLRDSLLESGGGLLGFVFTGRHYYIPQSIYRRI